MSNSARHPPHLGRGLIGAGLVLVVFAAPLLAPYDPQGITGPSLALPSAAHLLGTNDLGQDQLSQILYALRTSLLVGSSVAVVSMILSWSAGLLAGNWRVAGAILVPLIDLLLALPSLPLYILLLTLIGSSLLHLVLVLALLSWPGFARIVRGVVIATRAAPYVEAAWALGARPGHILLHHVLPTTLDVLPTKLILTMRYAIFAEASLAFLGVGDPTSISCGTMLGYAFADPLLFTRPVWPWLVLPPTLAVASLLVALGAITRARPAFAP